MATRLLPSLLLALALSGCDGPTDGKETGGPDDTGGCADATTWYGDGDGDGYGVEGVSVVACEPPSSAFVAEAGDCDDGDPAAYPGADEVCTDTADYNCDGSFGDDDADADGVIACEDCDDGDATAYPGGIETCDGVDNDCNDAVDDAATDASTWYTDADGDGYGDDATAAAACEQPDSTSAYGGDCDDADSAYNPAADESCEELVDYNCDGSVGGEDADADGTQACDDCDDTDATAYPGATEVCGGADEDCDGEIDEAGADGESTWYADADADTYGDAATAAAACAEITGYVADATDCDDTNDAINPAAAEICDAADTDEDCDGDADDADDSLDAASATEWYIDYDEDGYGADGTFNRSACEMPDGYVADASDCDDGDATVNPDGAEVCDDADADEDCDGASDDDDASATGQTTRYFDEDGDGYGSASTLDACDFTSDYVATADDCDDRDGGVSPGATEICDDLDVDEDCDGAADDASATGLATYYYDGDGDGFGDAAISVSTCDAAGSWVADATDCDDDDSGDYPGAAETIGNGDDEDCDDAEICYADADADGYRATAGSTLTSADSDCSDAGEALSSMATGDCDDGVASVSPAGIESCNSVDDDCDGTTDEDVGSTYYLDADNDGYGIETSTTVACAEPTGYASVYEDCDDTEASANPGGTEVCGDGLDNDCDEDSSDCGFDGTYAASTYDYRFTGTTSSEYMGKSVAVGDFDGDGTGDLAGGMYSYDSPASAAGAAAIWYGPIPASGTGPGTSDVLLTGNTSTQYAGYYMSAGDHDGDGADELVVSGYAVSSYAGAAYIVYGTAGRSGTSTFAAASDVATITGGTSSDYLGYNLAAGGDLDGDGTEEIVIGAYLQDTGGTSAGAAYVLYGSSTPRSGSASASASDAIITGAASSDYLGFAVSFVDDMNGDGLDELLVGAYNADHVASSSGAAYLFLGDNVDLSGTMSSSAADHRYDGTAASDYAGYGVYNLTDLDDDGYGDAGVSGYGYDGGGSSAGGLWVYSGGATLSTTATATVTGAASSDYLGEEACSVGDQDGDGTNDLLVGAYGVDTAYSSAGAAYLFYGPVVGTISASAADATFLGATTGDGYFGRRLPDRPADVTGDGVEDVIVGAYWDDSYAYDAGSLYVWAGLGGE